MRRQKGGGLDERKAKLGGKRKSWLDCNCAVSQNNDASIARLRRYSINASDFQRRRNLICEDKNPCVCKITQQPGGKPTRVGASSGRSGEGISGNGNSQQRRSSQEPHSGRE